MGRVLRRNREIKKRMRILHLFRLIVSLNRQLAIVDAKIRLIRSHTRLVTHRSGPTTVQFKFIVIPRLHQ